MDMSFLVNFKVNLASYRIYRSLCNGTRNWTSYSNIAWNDSKVDQQRRSGQYSEAEMNKISVATELQADFLLVFGQNKPITENIS
jgi:hypothetical protein